MSNSELTIHGRLTRDVEVTFGRSGTAVFNNSVAYNDRKKNESGEWEDGPATFLNIIAFGQMAEAIAESDLSKGSLVLASGQLKQENWETKEGEKKTSYTVFLNDIGASLKYLPKEKRNKPAPSKDYDDSSVPF